MKKTALLFPGQGSQAVGMGKELCAKYTVAAQAFEEANDVLGFDLRKICFEGSMEELTKTENTQPALLTTSVAMYRIYMQEFGNMPAYTAGHSLGEYSALTCAGALKFSDAVKIVNLRGKFMQEAVPAGIGAMAAISGTERERIADLCGGFSTGNELVTISNYNSPEQIVISGHRAAVDAVCEKLKEMGARVVPLKVSAPFHCALMQPAADMLRAELHKYAYEDLKFPVISNVTALPYNGSGDIIENLSMQIVNPVQWQASMEYIKENGVEQVLEIGPQTVLRNLMKKIAPSVAAFSFDKQEDMKVLTESLKPQSADAGKGKNFRHTVVTKCIAITVCTRNRNWDNEEYQKGVVEPYRRIQQMQDQIEKEGNQPTIGQMTEALEMLRSVFITKRTPVDEQNERFNQVFDETGTRHLFPDFRMPA